MAQNVARLGVILGIDVAEFTKGLNEAKNKLVEFASIASGIAVASIAGMVYKSLEMSDAMSDLADATGIAIPKILQISDALEMSGGHAEDAGKVLVKFADNIDKAAEGSKPLQDAFARVGVTLQDLSKLSTTELFDKSINGMTKLNDKASQTGASLALLGKGFRGTDVEGFNKLVKQSTEEFDRFGESVAKAADLHDKLAKKANETGLIFTEKVMPTLNAMFDAINTKGGAAETAFKMLNLVLIGTWELSREIGQAFDHIGLSWQLMTGKISASDFERKLMNLENEAILFRRRMEELQGGEPLTQGGPTPKKPDTTRPITPGKDPAAVRMEQMLAVSKLVSIEYQRQMSTMLQQQAIRNLMVGMTTNESRVQSAVNQVLDATSKKLEEIAKKKEEAIAHSVGTKQEIKKVTDELDRQAEEVTRLGDIFVDMARKNEEASIKSQQTFEFGWTKAFAQFKEDAYNNAKIAEDIFSSVTGNMTNAIDKFVTTGKLSFKDLTISILQDIEKIILRALVMKAITGITSSFSGGGVDNITTEQWTSGKFADGGNPPVGVPSLVGERGPELFIPRQSGTIIPNNQLASAMGGNGITYNAPVIQNMSAIDTQSALQFIAKNQNSIWAANQAAQRSLPQSR
jgi:hypothetical protein